jgi:hypothetical protein
MKRFGKNTMVIICSVNQKKLRMEVVNEKVW